jgi:hypothetical protein
MPNLTDRDKLEGDAWARKCTLDLLHSKFSQEFKAICNLRPLRGNQNLIEAHELELATIVLRYRNRFSKDDYFSHIQQCMKSADAAAESLHTFLEQFNQLRDSDQMNLVIKAANITDEGVFTNESYIPHLNLTVTLLAIIRTMKALSPGIKIATGVSERRRQGRPSSHYVQAALDLIFLWERILLASLPEPSPPYRAKTVKVPIAKKQVGRGPLTGDNQYAEATQPSTEFCRLAFRMINPKLKLKDAITAINNARELTEWLFFDALEDVRGKHSHDPVRHFIRDIATGNKNLKQKHLFSLPYLLRLYSESEQNPAPSD